MGSYYFRPDGLAVVTHDDGWTSPPLAIDELELEDAGHTPAPPPAARKPALANNAHQARPEARLDAGGGLGVDLGGGGDDAIRDWAMDQQVRAAVSKATPKAPPGTHAAPTPAPVAQQRGPALAMQNFDGAQPVESDAPAPGKVDPKRLRRVGGGAPAGGEQAESAAPRPTLVKGGMRLQSAVRQPGVELSDEVKHDLLETDDRAEQFELSADRIATQRQELANERQQMAIDQQRDIDRQVIQRQAIDRELGRQKREIGEREKEMLAKEPRSVREYWKDRGTLAQLGAIFTAAVGGYLQGLTGASRNSGLDQINEIVMADLAKEQDAYERARDRRDAAKNEYATALELYGTPEAAALDFQMRRYAAAERLLAARAEKVGTEEYKQQAAQLAQELRTERGKKRMELEQLQNGRFLQENWLNVPDQYVGGSPKPKEEQVSMLADRMEKAGLGEKAEQLGAVEDLISELPEGDLPTDETRNIVSRGIRGAADLIGGRGSGRALMDSPAERRAVAKVEQIKGKLRHELSGAAVSEQEQERLDAQLDQINTKEGLIRFHGDLQRRMERRKAGIRAGVAPEAVDEYERRRSRYTLPDRPRSQRVDDQ